MSHTLTRSQMLDALHEALGADPGVRAVWIAGSAATGRLDEYSDIDLMCAAADDHVEETIALVRRTLESLSPIEIEWRLPAPTWHGHEQAFYRLRDAGPHLLLDLLVMKLSAAPASRFLEHERHGVPRVLLDRDGFVVAQPMDRAAHEAKLRARLERLRSSFPLLQTIVTRAIARNQPCDAAYFYMQLSLLPVVEVLRMLHSPDRFDFGMRYLRDDLPAIEYARVCGLALPEGCEHGRGLEQLAARQRAAEALFRETEQTLRAKGY